MCRRRGLARSRSWCCFAQKRLERDVVQRLHIQPSACGWLLMSVGTPMTERGYPEFFQVLV